MKKGQPVLVRLVEIKVFVARTFRFRKMRLHYIRICYRQVWLYPNVCGLLYDLSLQTPNNKGVLGSVDKFYQRGGRYINRSICGGVAGALGSIELSQ